MNWKEEYKRLPTWTDLEVEDLLHGRKPDGSKGDDEKRKSARKVIRRSIEAGLLKPVSEKMPDDRGSMVYGPWYSFYSKEVALWVEKRGDFPKFPFKPSDLGAAIRPETSEEKLDQSEYWYNFKQKVGKSIEQYPAWRINNPTANKSGRLTEWICKEIGSNTREAEIIKHVLTDLFKDLK